MSDITPDELRNDADNIDSINRSWAKKLRSAADTIDRLSVQIDGYAAGFDTQHKENERLKARIAELEQQVRNQSR
jgi:peptidoglycan hydrolase CwlO-like protein